jgi:hypothetical protein
MEALANMLVYDWVIGRMPPATPLPAISACPAGRGTSPADRMAARLASWSPAVITYFEATDA